MQAEHLIALHYATQWLPQTQTWMYSQVYHLPPEVECHIVCERTENLDQFRLPNVSCLQDDSPLCFCWDKGLRRLQLQAYLAYLLTHSRLHQAHIVYTHAGNEGWLNRGEISFTMLSAK